MLGGWGTNTSETEAAVKEDTEFNKHLEEALNSFTNLHNNFSKSLSDFLASLSVVSMIYLTRERRDRERDRAVLFLMFNKFFM